MQTKEPARDVLVVISLTRLLSLSFTKGCYMTENIHHTAMRNSNIRHCQTVRLDGILHACYVSHVKFWCIPLVAYIHSNNKKLTTSQWHFGFVCLSVEKGRILR